MNQTGTNSEGSSVTLENVKIYEKRIRKSKVASSRGKNTEVTMRLLQK